MDRKTFLKKSALAGAALVSVGALALTKSETEKAPDQVGFNHLPNQKDTVMKNTILHKANTRGHANHGWLNSFHTFSFANYYNPERMNFGVLRVLNDDTVQAGMGFGTHPHNNMEIISIPLEGDLEHKDSMGNTTVIKNGDVQVMSAGTGIQHSEYNKNSNKPVKFLQIWVLPNAKNVTPRYDQITLKTSDRKNKFQQILSPKADDAGVWIHQNAWFYLADLDVGTQQNLSLQKPGNGFYVFLLSGKLNVADQTLETRDGLGVWEASNLNFTALEKSEVLVMEVPMQS